MKIRSGSSETEVLQVSSHKNLMDALTSTSASEDIAIQSYENVANLFLLARTFRSGASNGVETELAYVENAPGYVFVNPTTVISKKIPSRTISQSPGNDWSNQPSLLFSVQPQKQATIAHFGLASLNSFSSSDAISLMNRFARIERRTTDKLTLSKKIKELEAFLQKNWRETIRSVTEELSIIEGKALTEPLGASADRKFYKPFELFFHAKTDYSSLISSFNDFIEMLEQSNKLDSLTTNITLNPHPLAEIMAQHWAQQVKESASSDDEFDADQSVVSKLSPEIHDGSQVDIPRKTLHEELQAELQKRSVHSTAEAKIQATKERINKFKGLFFRAAGELKSRALLNEHRLTVGEEQYDDLIYERYCSYLDTGSRHNELVSRVYPWEITGIEWGTNDACKTTAVADAITTNERKKLLFQEFVEHKFAHPLFVDFMMNKLSIEHPDLGHEDIERLLQSQKTDNTEYLTKILEEIKLQCLNPVFIYEYSPTSRELVNISALVAVSQRSISPSGAEATTALSEDDSDHEFECKKAEKCRELFAMGISAYQDRLEGTVIIAPLSGIKKLPVRIKTTDLTDYSKFWERDTADKEMAEIIQRLADNIINQPYIDDKRELKDSSGRIIYRPNHDVMHATRKLSYKKHLFKLISGSQQEPWASTLKEFTQEEMACINLLLFLYRSGRTNEQGSSSDPTNAKRSANVFELVALQLGFNELLVRSMKHSLDHIPINAEIGDYSSEGYTGKPEIKAQKAFLIHRIADISHGMDLVRCNSWRQFFETEKAFLKAKHKDPTIKNFKFDLVKKMEVFFPDAEEANKATDDLLLLAKKSCEVSGTPVFYDEFSSSEKVSSYNEPLKDQSLLSLVEGKLDKSLPLSDIKSYWTQNTSACSAVLDEVLHVVEEELLDQKSSEHATKQPRL